MKVRWREWGRDAFEAAKKENKPILLSISAVWCHWCHKMSEDNYENDQIAEIINKNFIPVIVDTDKRPDINERYNQGGWPSTAFLTPEGDIMSGYTYIQPAQMPRVLQETALYFKEGKHKIEQGPEHVKKPRPKDIDITILDAIHDELIAYYDAENGGFGAAPKFPIPEAIEFLANKHEKRKDPGVLRMINKTLEGMIGLFDWEEGGFFRYSVTHNWMHPHFEKMLDVNAKMLRAYVLGYKLTGNERYRQVAEKTVEFLTKVLSNGQDRFYGSQDADGELEYYGKTMAERQKIKKPFIDKNVYTDWNSAAVIAFLDTAEALGSDKYRNFALAVLDFLLAHCYDETVGAYHYYESQSMNAYNYGLLVDNAWLMKCLVHAYEVTKKEQYARHAEHIAHFILEGLKDGTNGFFDKITKADDAGLLKQRRKNFFDNATAAEALAVLARKKHIVSYKTAAQHVLEEFAGDIKRYGPYSATYGLAAEKLLEP